MVAKKIKAQLTFYIYRALAMFVKNGGSLPAAKRVLRESLFYISEEGNLNKYGRHPHSVAAKKIRGTIGKRYDHAIPLNCWLGAFLQDDLTSEIAFCRRLAKFYHVRIFTSARISHMA